MLIKWYEVNALSPFPAEAPPLDGAVAGVAFSLLLLVVLGALLARSVVQSWLEGS
jgi:hypothetical protein